MLCLLSGLRLFSRPQQASASQSNGDNDAYSTHAWQPCTTRPAVGAPREVETPAEDTFGNTQAHCKTLVVKWFCPCPACCLCRVIRMTAVVVQGCGRSNQRRRSRVRLCLRYQTFTQLTDWWQAMTSWLPEEKPSCWQNNWHPTDEGETFPNKTTSYLTLHIPVVQFWFCWWCSGCQPDWCCLLQLMDHFTSTDLWNQTGEQRGWRTQTLWDQWQCTSLYCR